MDRITITRPDDWHIHLRDGEHLVTTVPHVARQFARAIVMPNLKPPVATVDDAIAYRDRILAARPAGSRFRPLLTLYLTDRTTAEEIERAAACPDVVAVKLYPAGATTNSDRGVADLRGLAPVLEVMAQTDLLLLVHGEVTDPEVDVFDREAVFLERELAPILERHPQLHVVLEHITTEQAVAFVRAGGPNLAATITAHHLLLNRNAMFQGGLSPHAYCLPVLKRERHRQALLGAACSGEPKFFLGTDSAPHRRTDKVSDCGCAGIYTAHAAMEFYAEAFDSMGALEYLEGFASQFGPDFYGLPRNRETISLVRRPSPVPASYPLAGSQLVPMRGGETTQWQLVAPG
ncbi:MAG: dihydroorotase [Myxococcales bacterium FL481]|nr:MAG: dihydroorotase [Myxococcales bacterium FL481]